MKAAFASAVLVTALVVQGCDSAPKTEPKPAPESQVKAVAPAPAPPPVKPGPTATTPPKLADDPNVEKAEAGVGEKGRGYGGEGFITTPISAKFRLEERITFEIKIPEAMKLYKANHNNKGPKSDAEFQRKIIEENSILLPELPAGDSYIYDPATEELMVRHPKK